MRPLAIIAIALLPLAASPAAAQETCKLTALGTVQVATVRDGRTLSLTDGRELRLAGIEAADESREALQDLVRDRPLRLEGVSTEPDRYGRLVAFAYAGDDRRSVQEALLDQGQARVSARVGNKACAAALLAAERSARAANRGLWADPNFAPLRPDNYAGLRADRGLFTIVEGKVLSVRGSGSTICLNFGRRLTRDFSVIVLRRNQRIFNAAGLDLKQLEGRRIRVRGWPDQRRGPVIAVSAPEQIEFADDTMTNASGTRQ
jgi:endonuclease YncB( thermonuclease family)